MRERFHLDAPGWFRRDEPVPHLAALSRAVWEEQRVEIRYQKRDGEVSRVLDPLGLVLKAGVWYLVALSGRTRSYRTFRVGRVRSVKLLDQDCERPPDFDLAAHWADAQEGFLGSWETVPVRVRVRENLTWLVRHVHDPRRAEDSFAAAPEPDAEGWITFTLQFQSYEVAGYDLMRFGGDLEVLEPAEVRQAVATRAASMVARYTDVPA
jgi:predicted DNA-binding transcriptional regulator YafY